MLENDCDMYETPDRMMGLTASAAAAFAAADVMDGPLVGPERVEDRHAETTPGSALPRDWNVLYVVPFVLAVPAFVSSAGRAGGAD